MRPFARLCAVFLLAACQMLGPKTVVTGDQPSAIAPETITVTTLDGAAGAAVSPTSAAKPASTDAQSAAAKPAIATAAAPAIPVQLPTKTTPRPMPRPVLTAATASQQTVAPVAPPPISPEQALCEKSRGQWSEMPSSSGHVCVHRTRDAGKSCRKKGDCQGECLAKSGTCSPIRPLVGCNDILQADGSEVTLCLQ